jgi:dihydroorotate dehydrogenase
MPDWSYQTIGRSVLFLLPADVARRGVVGFLGRMAALPQGFRIVDWLGHMTPDPSIARTVAGIELSSPLGLAPLIDPEGRAIDAFSRFGFGLIVVGPVGRNEPERPPNFAREENGSRGILIDGTHSLGLQRAREIAIRTPGDVRLAFELALPDSDPAILLDAGTRLIDGLAGRAEAFVLSPRSWTRIEALQIEAGRVLLSRLAARAREAGAALLVGMPVDVDSSSIPALTAELDVGVYVSGRLGGASTQWRWSESDHAPCLKLVRDVRATCGGIPIFVDGGVFSPKGAIELDAAGADVVLLGAGLVFSGPGLAKRTNEAIEHVRSQWTNADVEDRSRRRSGDLNASLPVEQRAWFWGAVLGAAMFVGALMATWIALSTVLLPYDESFVGKTRAEIEASNPRIVHFLTHDRATLAGTMVSVGVLYFALSVFGMRRGQHSAQRIVSVSAVAGFATFFAFLGFGYFDPFHAFVTAMLLQFLIQVIVRPLGTRRRLDAPPPLDNDRAWKLSQWSQLLFVVQAIGLIAGGLTILSIGMTSVFVPEDIAFLRMAPAEIRAFDPELIPLIAHDRATFGGMLVSAGLALLLTTLWTFRRGDRWLWWTYLLTILPPYAMTLWIHAHIGYTDTFHLSPVFIGLGLLALGLVLGAPHLLGGRRVEASRDGKRPG